MIKVAILIIFAGLFYLGLGTKNNNKVQRTFGVKVAAVGVGLIIVSQLFNVSIFPQL